MASILAALAYAEFGARYPRAGSAYSYVYFSMGEFLAFVVGWNVLLENILATSAVTQACGSYIDSLTGGAISNFIGEYIGFLTRPEALHVYNNVTSVADDVGQLGVDAPFLNNVPQLLVIPIMMAFVLVLLLGTTGSSTVGNILCGLNIAMLLVIIGIGLWKGRLNNWTDPQTGGFLPRGWHGVFSAASMCFFSYGGFDAISASAEEAKNPRRSLPIAIMSAMLTVTVLYVGVAASFTLLSNWSTLSSVDGFPETMRSNGIYWAQYLVTVGALCGMTTVGVVTLYTIARAAMSMAEDGLLCTVFANVWNRSQVPAYSTLIFAAISATIAVLFRIESIIDMLSIGTLMSYMTVTCGLVVYRYAGTTLPSPLRLRYVRPLESVLSSVVDQRLFIYLNLNVIIWTSLALSFFVQTEVKGGAVLPSHQEYSLAPSRCEGESRRLPPASLKCFVHLDQLSLIILRTGFVDRLYIHRPGPTGKPARGSDAAAYTARRDARFLLHLQDATDAMVSRDFGRD